MLDLRVPSGWFFLLMGVILAGYGLAVKPTAALTTANVDLYTGIAMLVFGGGLLWLARRAS